MNMKGKTSLSTTNTGKNNPKNYVFVVSSGFFFPELFPSRHPTIKCLVFLGVLTASDSPEEF